MTSTVGPTVVAERAGRRNLGFAAGLALLALAIVSPMLRTEPIESGTQIAIGALILVALGIIGLWVYTIRNPTSLVIADDEIRLEPGGLEPERRRIPRSAGSLRIAKEGSLRSKTLVLSTLDREHRLPLHFMDRQEIVDACYDHGWDFGPD